MREADISDGSRVAYGSDEHTNDLERRLSEMEGWRDKQRKGSSSRADYARVVHRIKQELRSARRAADRNKPDDVLLDEAFDVEPEHNTVATFVQYLLDDERDTFTHEDLAALNYKTRMPIGHLRDELESYGFKLAERVPPKQVRGFSSNSHDRWHGPGSLKTHGGAGIDSTTGRATVKNRTI